MKNTQQHGFSRPLPQWFINISLILIVVVVVGIAFFLTLEIYSWISHISTGGPGIP